MQRAHAEQMAAQMKAMQQIDQVVAANQQDHTCHRSPTTTTKHNDTEPANNHKPWLRYLNLTNDGLERKTETRFSRGVILIAGGQAPHSSSQPKL